MASPGAASVVGPGMGSILSKFVLKLFRAWQGVETSQPQSWEARSMLLWETLTGHAGEPSEVENYGYSHTVLP